MKSLPTLRASGFAQVSQWILDPVGYLQSNFERYGDLFPAQMLWNSSVPMILANEPKAVQFLLTRDRGKEFSAPGEANQILEQLLGSQSLVLLSGERHQQRRKLIMPPFHGERIRAYSQLIQTITQEAIAAWPLDKPIDIRDTIQSITMRVILQAVFGLHEGDRYQKLEHLLALRLGMTNSPLASALIFLPWLRKDFGTWSPGGRIRQIAEETDRLLFAEIQDRRAHPDPDRIDILSLLLTAKDENGDGLSDRELRDELMTLLMAGHETTATSLTWALYWVHKLPQVKQKLVAELESMSDPGDASQFSQLQYLSAVCNETLRIYPVAMLTFPRRVEKPVELCGYQLDPGAIAVGCIYLIHQREDLYPNPHEFRPERFLENQFSPYEFLPFGGGSRRCVGAALAASEMRIVLGTILTHLDLALASDRPVKPGRRGVTLAQSSPVRLKKLGERAIAAPAFA
ncbi:MAG: cytochrome P450 [Cyanobacteria bacterium J06639_1]